MLTSLFETQPAAFATTSALVDANGAFAVDLYQKEKAQPGNLFFSPYSISTALAMTYTGARGQTQQEMARALHFSLTPEDLAKDFAALSDSLAQVQKAGDAKLAVANSLWCQRSYPFADSFLDLNRKYYRSELRLVDFAKDAAGVRQDVNTWVAQQTQDKIRDLLQPPEPSPAARLLLCNAIYFTGDWLAQFDRKATQPAPFFTRPGSSVSVPMMSQKLNVQSRTFEHFTLFALPYTGKALSLLIFLPEAVDGLAALENQLEAARLTEWLAALDKAHPDEARVFLPRFTLDCRLELSRDLAAMGMPTAFGAEADFSGMTGKRDLYISAVVHQAFVDVNEQGTEAAAATAVTMRSLAVRLNPVLRVDHPFMFLIRENQTGSILFLGRVLAPGEGALSRVSVRRALRHSLCP